ncbi:ATP-binding cassette domain-containing protein [Paenibacillus sp. GCM10027626]|uniref:ATP-binding cassette domain-containing protein n=1 Tax=Paenibacillus sp. GCM10027626 TaxID=3273411 RepID=UPI0036422EBA
MLAAYNLGKKYKREWALKPLTFRLERGMHGLLGPNGAGKSTLMRLLAGLLVPTSGDALLQGVSVRNTSYARSRIGYVPQVFKMYPQLTGRELLLHTARLVSQGTRAQQEKDVDRIIHAVHLEDNAFRPVRTYSHGMVKRLGIAQALLGNPDILIVDEPTTGLDPEERVRLRNLLAELAMRSVVLLSTHILSDVTSSCKDVIVLREGELCYKGSLGGLAQCAAGRVWEWQAAQTEWRSMAQERLLLAKRTPDGILCRTLADERPTPYAEPAEPTMEDGYLALIANGQAAFQL